MTVSHQPPVNPAAGDLFDDFYIRQAAGQAVVDIRLKAADAGAAGGKDLAIAEQDHRRIVGQHFIQLVVIGLRCSMSSTALPALISLSTSALW